MSVDLVMGSFVLYLIERRGYSPEEIARRAGLPVKEITRLERKGRERQREGLDEEGRGEP